MIRDHLIPEAQIEEQLRPKILRYAWIVQVRLFCLDKLGIKDLDIPWRRLYAELGKQLSGEN
ncbi:MAG: hypothetical protein ACLP7A_15350 [Desulfobaccales bacterium]